MDRGGATASLKARPGGRQMGSRQVFFANFHHEHSVIAFCCHACMRKPKDLAKPIAGEVALASTPLATGCGCVLQEQPTVLLLVYLLVPAHILSGSLTLYMMCLSLVSSTVEHCLHFISILQNRFVFQHIWSIHSRRHFIAFIKSASKLAHIAVITEECTSAFQAQSGLMAQHSMTTSRAKSPSGAGPENPLAAAHRSLT